MTAISYHDTVNDLQGLSWADDGPFARLEWFRLLEEGAARPLFALAREGPEAVALPLQFADGRVEALTNWYAFTWQTLRTSQANDASMLAALARDLTGRTNRIVFAKLDDDTADSITEAFSQTGWIVLREPCDTNHILRLQGRGFAAYLVDRPGPLRTTLKRKARKVDIALSDRFAEDDWSAYEAIYADSWKPEEGDPALLRRFAQMESGAGRYRLGIARHDGEPVAAQFWTVDGGTAYIHKLAHRESAKALSAGTTLTAALFERVIDTDGVTLVDFGTGDDAYKRDWMEERRVRWQLTCLRPSAPRNWPVMARALARKLVRRGSGV